MNRSLRRRGEPLVALGLVLAAWVGARAVLWEGEPVVPELAAAEAARFAIAVPKASSRVSWPDREVTPGTAPAAAPPRAGIMVRQSRPVASPSAMRSQQVVPMPVRPASGQPLLGMAGPSEQPLPDSQLAPPLPASAPFYPAGREPASRERRWSADGWLLLRRGGRTGLGAGGAPASYGASQAGAVLRYRLAPGSGHRPAAYARISAALDGSRQKEAALGLSARPFPQIPVIAAVELRATRDPFGTRFRPVAMAITEFPPLELPLDIRAEAYAQAGYVEGKGATAFADGQLRLDRRVTGIGRAELRAGGGVWGGAQEGASRLDFGPSATLGVPVGRDVWARMGIDWRFRVAGNAAPTSGPAFTLSAGF